MKIRSLLLGSVAAAGLATTGYAADLGVVTSLDICDELGLSGLAISSDDNCLVITGGVTFEYSIGDYAPGADVVFFDIDDETDALTIADADGTTDSDLDIDAWLKFVATASSDFGPATATIKLLSENISTTADPAVVMDEAWVGIGDTTVLMAGHKGSIFNDGDDAPLNYLGLFNSSKVDAGVGFDDPGADTGGNVIQLTHNLGNGLSISGGLENLQTSSPALITGVGTLAYAGDGISAHISGAVDQDAFWKTHAGFKGTWDPITVVAALSANEDTVSGNIHWNALASVSATFDMFTIAVSGEARDEQEYGVGGSIGAQVTDTVKLNLGGRYFEDLNGNDWAWQVEGGIEAAVTETITLTAAAGVMDGNELAGSVFYGKGGLAWAPGGGFTSSIEGYANTLGAYKATFKAAKTIK